MARLLFLMVTVSLGACLSPAEDVDEPTVFLAQTRNFRGFMQWERQDLGEAPLDDGTLANRTVYVNKRPQASGSFPVGTIFVKTTEPDDDRANWQVHAMVKRGRNFNLKGARGWEWLELSEVTDDVWQIDWRGEEPPSGATYRCVIDTGEEIPSCNVCHMAARARDYVITRHWEER